MANSLYESFVKEYLETEGYLVYTNLIYKKRRNEIDILAYKPKDNTFLVGEVKALNNLEKLRREAKELGNDELRNFLKDKYGIKSYERWIFCWNLEEQEDKVKEEFKKNYKTTVITYPEMIAKIFQKSLDISRKPSFYDVNRPYTISLQLINYAMKTNSKHLQYKLKEWNKE